MSHINQYFFFGLKGKLAEQEYRSLKELSEDHHDPPRVEMRIEDADTLPKELTSFNYISEKESQLVYLMACQAYCAIGRYGFFGDAVRVSRYEVGRSYSYIVDFIGQLGYDKLGYAADMLPFIRDIDGNLFFVCIRKEQVGQGPYALVGGFVDSSGLETETFAQAAIREAGEEIGMRIGPSGFGALKILVPDSDDIPVTVEFQNGECAASSLKLVGTFFTATSQREREVGYKRVHITTAYLAVIEIGRSLTCVEIAEMLMKNEEVEEIIVVPADEFDSAEFKDSHHREIFDRALVMLRMNGR